MANERGLIASSLASAGARFGLTAIGREEVAETVKSASADETLVPPVRLLTSPLLRARETAQIVGDLLEVTGTVDVRLTERGFGTLDLEADVRYEAVWDEDRRDPRHERWGVESIHAVLARAGSVVDQVVGDHGAGSVLLCTHGDVASTLLCAAMGLPLNRHREVGALGTGALRQLPQVTKLPEALG